MRGIVRIAGGRGHNGDSSVNAVAEMQSNAMTAFATDGATALKPSSEVMFKQSVVTKTEVRASSGRPQNDRVAEARLRGYEGESCRECQNFTLVRNGTCLKCDTCGSTSGCS